MNIDWNLANRAMLLAGQHEFTEEDRTEKNAAFVLVKQFYLSTVLEALSEVEWAGGRKRGYLMRTGIPHKINDRFRFAYDTPFDCAKPLELEKNEYFLVEGRFIYTDQEHALLLYISNGKALRPAPLISSGKPGDIMGMEYLSAGRPPDRAEFTTIHSGHPEDIQDLIPGEEENEDYPDYQMPVYEHKFYQYAENMLAAKCAMHLSNQPELHTRLLQQAVMIKAEAVEASLSSRAAGQNPRRWWLEELGVKSNPHREKYRGHAHY
jgi:hypothetical protein